MFYLASARITRLTLVPLLALWIAGTGCLLGCESEVQAGTASHRTAGHEGAKNLTEEECASSKSHGCCQKQLSHKEHRDADKGLNSSAKIVNVPEDSGSMMGCPFASSRIAVMTKVRDDSAPVAIHYRPTPSLPPIDEGLFAFPASFLPRDRGHTYLRCCVFLI